MQTVDYRDIFKVRGTKQEYTKQIHTLTQTQSGESATKQSPVFDNLARESLKAFHSER